MASTSQQPNQNEKALLVVKCQINMSLLGVVLRGKESTLKQIKREYIALEQISRQGYPKTYRFVR